MSQDKVEVGLECMYCGTRYTDDTIRYRGCCGEVHFEPFYECEENCSCDSCFKPKMRTITKEEFDRIMAAL